ncbi:glycosyltransferase [Flavobacterium maritimum]|uniref:glycosyltransferase n=1 Tax=Flavobacterium maritimum TaxID=3149042 RepID=UPI0032B423AE
MKRKKLVIISHTEHYADADGIVKGWGSTVNEINFLADSWETIYHVGCLYSADAPASSLAYTKDNIHFVPIPPYGGKRLWDKFLILVKLPKIIFQVVRTVRGASEVQLRLPTSMGLFLLPLFSFFIPRTFTFWLKYAGNWAQVDPPIGYAIQRWWLQKNIARCPVTINGFWRDQPTHCLSFENPCLTNEDIEEGKLIGSDKTFTGPFEFVFVGRLEKEKGVDRIIEALSQIEISQIKKMHFIGDGISKEKYKRETKFLGDKVQFYGFLNSGDVHQLLKRAHFVLLPSTASEGFPKVIAEAACYGVIPIVSNVGSIGHYIDNTNGFVWDVTSDISYNEVLLNTVNSNASLLKEMSGVVLELAEKFTFTNYISKLKLSVLQSIR